MKTGDGQSLITMQLKKSKKGLEMVSEVCWWPQLYFCKMNITGGLQMVNMYFNFECKATQSIKEGREQI